VALGQCGLDSSLACQRPVERGVEFVVVDCAETEHFTQAGERGGRRQRPGRSQFRCWFEAAAEEQREDEVTATIAVRAKDAVKTDLACCAEGGGDVTVGKESIQNSGVLLGFG
jgi:hypothetical protein